MPEIRLLINRPGDPPPWTDLAEGPDTGYTYVPDAGWQVAVLAGGMTSGAPAIILRVDTGHGKPLIIETSLAAWIAATAGMRGAFPAEFAATPLRDPNGG